jgi:hypothetical protein
MYCVYGDSGWHIDCCLLYSRLGVSVIGSSTVLHSTHPFAVYIYAYRTQLGGRRPPTGSTNRERKRTREGERKRPKKDRIHLSY